MSDPRFGRDDEPMPAWRGRSLVVSVVLHGSAYIGSLGVNSPAYATGGRAPVGIAPPSEPTLLHSAGAHIPTFVGIWREANRSPFPFPRRVVSGSEKLTQIPRKSGHGF